MSVFSRLGKGLSSLFEPVSKVAKDTAKPLMKVGGDSKVIKTTSQTIGNTLPAIAGGKSIVKSIAKDTAKTVTGSASVKGRTLIPAKSLVKAGAVSAGVLGAGLGAVKIGEYAKEVINKTPEQIQAEQAYGLYKNITNDQAQNVPGSSGINGVDGQPGDPNSQGSGGNFFDFYKDMQQGDATDAQNNQTLTYGILGAVALGAGLLYASKKGMFKKKKSKK